MVGRFKELKMKNRQIWLALPIAALAASTLGVALASHGWMMVDRHCAKPLAVDFESRPTRLRSAANEPEFSDRLVGARLPEGRVSLQQFRFENDRMQVGEVSSLDLPCAGDLALHLDRRHVLMLLDINKPIRAGDSFDLTLVFDQAEARTLKVSVPNELAEPRSKLVDRVEAPELEAA